MAINWNKQNAIAAWVTAICTAVIMFISAFAALYAKEALDTWKKEYIYKEKREIAKNSLTLLTDIACDSFHLRMIAPIGKKKLVEVYNNTVHELSEPKLAAALLDKFKIEIESLEEKRKKLESLHLELIIAGYNTELLYDVDREVVSLIELANIVADRAKVGVNYAGSDAHGDDFKMEIIEIFYVEPGMPTDTYGQKFIKLIDNATNQIYDIYN